MVSDDEMYTVTWQPNIKGLKTTLENGIPPREMTEFFNMTRPEELKIIFEKMARKAVAEKQK